MKAGRIAVWVGAVLASAVLLAACRAQEQGRVLHYDKGHYLGQKDTALGEKRVHELLLHTARQRGGG